MEPSRTNKLLSFFKNKKKLSITSASLLVVMLVVSLVVYETSKAMVTMNIDGEETILTTHASTVAELLAENEWEMNEHDKITPSLETAISSNMEVEWKKAKLVTLTVNDDLQTVWTTADSVNELFEELAIDVKEHDAINPSLDTEITPDMNVSYESAFLVQLISDGEQQEIWTTSTTVADFLEKENIALGELDRVEPAKDELLDKETKVDVIRVEKVTDVVEEKIAFATVTRKDDSLDKGKENVVESGQEGLVKKHYEVIIENGEEVSRELVKTENVRDSKDRIVAVGNKQPPAPVSRSSSPSSSSSSPSSSSSGGEGTTITVTATAYTANCSGCSGITATGIDLNKNRNKKVIAVDPSVIPLGSRVHVEGYGEAIAGDTGGNIVGNKIDVHVPSRSEAQRWGVRTVKVTILD
ncbi:G5 and 3D domain-containing protein [Alkalihalobacillus sp. LMS39]|uniref:G5 and 3D domain-containing protein n=1 Tax=Alkalihalobacillus sp. LMS39 TaxID=2924032 RepID=UPI001FB42513|nr:G5 and 3D domain-containing protein [Alkalihalobacillus sp. LMS39]UOE94180.1 ubiquitin-like domain-containing protein [Alkalihalobacillus sp. LMS39]